MEETLRDVCTVAGVRGCFVCDGEGRVIASAPVDRFDQQALEIVGRTLSQTTNGLLMSRRRKIHEIDLLYSDGRLVVKPLAEGCLGVICARTMNVPLLNLTTSVAAKKLTEAMKGEAPQAKAAAPETIELDRATEEIASAYPDLVGPVMHLDQTLAPETREATLTSLGKSAGAAIFRKRYASTRVPPSISQGLQLVVMPAVAPFAIADAQGNRLNVSACPFCRNLSSPLLRCQFLAGFVQGLLNSIRGLEGVVVGETLCQAKGDNTCSFVAESRQD